MKILSYLDSFSLRLFSRRLAIYVKHKYACGSWFLRLGSTHHSPSLCRIIIIPSWLQFKNRPSTSSLHGFTRVQQLGDRFETTSSVSSVLLSHPQCCSHSLLTGPPQDRLGSQQLKPYGNPSLMKSFFRR